MVGKYLKALTANSWSSTWKRFGETWQGWFITGLTFLIGVGIHAWYKDWDVAADDAVVAVLTGLGGAICVMVLYFIWKWVSAPYRIWKADRLRDSQQKKALVKEDFAAMLEAHLMKGEKVLAEFAFLENQPDVAGWRGQAEDLLEKYAPRELRAFRTLFPPSGDDGMVMRHVWNVGEKEILEGLMGKLRNIMMRQSGSE